jgi:hypothetical protein
MSIKTLFSCLIILFLFLLQFQTFGFAQVRKSSMGTVSVTGRVLEEDGQPASEMLQVDLVCNGRIRMQTLASSDGTFVFDMNSAYSESWLDPASGGSANGAFEGSAKMASPGGASALDEVPSTGRGMVTLTGCEIRLSPRPGISSNAISLRTRNSFDNPDVGVIIIKRLSNSKATIVSLNTLNAPKKARSAFNKANDALTEKTPDYKKALKELNKAVEVYPQFSAAWDLMARIHLSQGNRENGENCFLRAIEEEPKFIRPYLGLAQIAFQDNNWSSTANWSSKVLDLDSNYPQALYWHGLAAFYLRNFEASEKSLSSLYESGHSRNYPFGLFPLGVVHANQGKIAEAVKELDLYLQLMPENQIPEAQRKEMEKQIASWRSEGLAPPPEPEQPSPE